MSAFPTYRKKPIDVPAVQWTGDNLDELVNFTNCQFSETSEHDRAGEPELTAEVFDKLHSTWVRLRTGDYVLKGTQGEFYPCARSVFEETYEPTGPAA
jgi:hypothetical protein